MLTINEIYKYYNGLHGEIHALDGVSLTVHPSEFVAVRGPSGCGKTTLLLICGGLLNPDEGTVSLDGRNTYEMDSSKRAKNRAAMVGFVFQQFHLVPYLNVLENIQVPSVALPTPDAKTRALELAERFNLNDRLNHMPSELSTGERQRTALARSLMNNPKIILADEPTGNLDDGNAETVLCALRDVADSGRSVLMVTHDIKASDYAHRMLSMDSGKLHAG